MGIPVQSEGSHHPVGAPGSGVDVEGPIFGDSTTMPSLVGVSNVVYVKVTENKNVLNKRMVPRGFMSNG